MYKISVSSASHRIRNLDRSKLFKKQIHPSENEDDAIRNRIKKNVLEQSVSKSNQLVSDLKSLATEFAHQVNFLSNIHFQVFIRLVIFFMLIPSLVGSLIFLN